jgi:hypothetical protein
MNPGESISFRFTDILVLNSRERGNDREMPEFTEPDLRAVEEKRCSFTSTKPKQFISVVPNTEFQPRNIVALLPRP